jgi:hypothetical protein
MRAGAVYVEVHKDIYGYAPAIHREATTAGERAKLVDRIDQNLLLAALEDGGGGMPVRVTPDPSPAAELVRVNATVQEPLSAEAPNDGVPHSDDAQAGDD